MKRVKTTLRVLTAGLLVSLAMIIVYGQVSCAAYRGPPSDHFDGTRFYYPGASTDHTFGEMIKWLWEMDTVDWPTWIADPKTEPPPPEVDTGRLRVTYINHATVLIQLDGVNIITDPIWSERAGPVSWLGPKRIRAPGVLFEELPEIDYVLISHNHYDHLDLPTLKRLGTRHDPLFLAGLGLKAFLENNGLNRVGEMDWWESRTTTEGLVIHFVPARHGSARGLFDDNKTLWGGFVINGSHGSVYFAGDTAFQLIFEEIAKRFEIRLSILPIGSYEKRWFMRNQHMNPDDAVKAHIILNSKQSMGMHYGTFLEHPEQTVDAHEKDLANALADHDVAPERFWVLGFGEGREVLP